MSSSNTIPATGIIWRLSLKWRAAIDRGLADLGLTHAQYAVLAPLSSMTRNGKRPSQRELADSIGLEPLYVSKLVRALERVGYVERAEDPDDARAVRLALTRLGRQVTTKAIALVVGMQDELTAPLGGARSRRTRDFLDAAQVLLTGDVSNRSEDMTAPQALIAQHIGQAEKAMRTVLDRLLTETGTEFVAWVIMSVLAANGPTMEADQLVGRVVSGQKIAAEHVQAIVDALASRGLLAAKDGRLGLTMDGEALHGRLRDGIGQITERLYGGIPTPDLLTTQRVLAIVTQRANDELGS